MTLTIEQDLTLAEIDEAIVWYENRKENLGFCLFLKWVYTNKCKLEHENYFKAVA
jgi:hypothetical protein